MSPTQPPSIAVAGGKRTSGSLLVPPVPTNGEMRRGSKEDRDRSKSRSPRQAAERMGSERRGSKESLRNPRRGSKESIGASFEEQRRSSKEAVAAERNYSKTKGQSSGQRSLKRKQTPKHWGDKRFTDKAFLDALFIKFDPELDGSGSLDCRLMFELLRSVDMELQFKEVEQLVRQIDLDGNGTVELDEFHFFFSKAKDRAELKSMTKKLIKTDEKAFVKELFKNFDSAGLGNMVEADLFELTEFLNMELSRDEVHVLLKTIDLDGNGTIEIDELLFFFDKVKSRNELVGMMKNMATNNREFLRKVFEMFDPENTGSLTESQLFDVTKFMKLDFSRRAVKGLLAKMDEDGNGTVELDEFFAFFDQIKDIKEMKKHCDRNRQSQDNRTLVQRIGMAFTTVVGIVFLVLGSSSEESGMSTTFTLFGVMCLIIGFMFAMSQFGAKVVGTVITNVFCKCTKKRLMMWGGLCFVIFLILIVVEVISTSGPAAQQDEEEAESLMPIAIVFVVLCAVFCMCSVVATNLVAGVSYAQEVAPEDPSSPTPRLKKLGSFGTPRMAGKGSGIQEPQNYGSERTKGSSRNSGGGGQKKKGLGFTEEP